MEMHLELVQCPVVHLLEMEHDCGALHLWFGRGHNGNWAVREVDSLADLEKPIQTLSRIHDCQ
ncbi:hypothetical protein CIPAW_12G134700 [Carya illinoinensis]|uniref:Uncharacterized protein n=1 Tax=Carya illinoinensis TaxID=32201 RepID=A0A8T1P174_CARIL|nr:hypothetical protein CIPAW_12G134700 [Carya illinoinensis]KAG6634687.1 hypothetical protein CIPAW_12G134700 [Carya illinoinensis]KAG6634688.1 hypothetical protein CIPAW_12G134700 [Carya illinoinensis]